MTPVLKSHETLFAQYISCRNLLTVNFSLFHFFTRKIVIRGIWEFGNGNGNGKWEWFGKTGPPRRAHLDE